MSRATGQYVYAPEMREDLKRGLAEPERPRCCKKEEYQQIEGGFGAELRSADQRRSLP